MVGLTVRFTEQSRGRLALRAVSGLVHRRVHLIFLQRVARFPEIPAFDSQSAEHEVLSECRSHTQYLSLIHLLNASIQSTLMGTCERSGSFPGELKIPDQWT